MYLFGAWRCNTSIYCAATPIADRNILSLSCLAHTAYVECEISMAGFICLRFVCVFLFFLFAFAFLPFPFPLPLSFPFLFCVCVCEHNPQSADLATRPRLLLAIKANNTAQTNLEGLVNSNGHSCGGKQTEPQTEDQTETTECNPLCPVPATATAPVASNWNYARNLLTLVESLSWFSNFYPIQLQPIPNASSSLSLGSALCLFFAASCKRVKWQSSHEKDQQEEEKKQQQQHEEVGWLKFGLSHVESLCQSVGGWPKCWS